MNTAGTSRLEAFSDGVFSIAITLLVLEIKLPDGIHSAAELWLALGRLWTSYVGYVLSFLVIGVMWANHHSLFEYITRLRMTQRRSAQSPVISNSIVIPR